MRKSKLFSVANLMFRKRKYKILIVGAQLAFMTYKYLSNKKKEAKAKEMVPVK